MIEALEPQARGIYCGAIGVVRPGGHATFNVAIRTVTLRGTSATCGIGSGITFDATAEAEWQEWRIKRGFLERASESFKLLETLRLENGSFHNLDAHLARLQRAAAHFGFPFDEGHLKLMLKQLRTGPSQGTGHEPAVIASEAWQSMTPEFMDCHVADATRNDEMVWRVRLLLNASGHAQVEAFALPPSPTPVMLHLADKPFDAAHSEFTRFKTTHRAHYEAFAPTDPAVFDTLLYNEAGELTECTRGNIALLLDGRWITPPLRCGLLDGIGREMYLKEGRLLEAVVRVDDLPRVQALAFINSLRGWLDARVNASGELQLP